MFIRLSRLFDKGGALAGLVFKFEIPHLHNLVIRTAPIVASDKAYEAIYKLDLLSATGTAILLPAIVSMLVLRVKPMDGLRAFGEVLTELRRPIFSIGMVLAFAFVANY
jgi:L-lactate permease